MNTININELWKKGNLPIKDGLYYRDGRCISLETFTDPLRIEKRGTFDLNDFLSREPDYVTTIDITKEEHLKEIGGYFCCGEGSYGSEGFFAYLNSDKEIIWVVYFESLNPFVDFSVKNDVVIVSSTLEVPIAVNLLHPEGLFIAS